jgi:hypothetical protein
MTQPEYIDDSARSVIQADGVCAVQLHLSAPYLKCVPGESMSLDRRGHHGLPRLARYRNVMNRQAQSHLPPHGGEPTCGFARLTLAGPDQQKGLG